jgi:hypothetical protein
MSSDEIKKINAILVIEILGRPPEYLIETLKDIAKKMGEEKGVKVKDVKTNEPVLMKDQKDFYTSFAEIEVETEGILHLAILMFKYMPAHIDILSPQNINLTNNEWNDILNELTRRLHGYEEIARILQNEKRILENRLREALEPKKINKEVKKKKK